MTTYENPNRTSLMCFLKKTPEIETRNINASSDKWKPLLSHLEEFFFSIFFLK